MKREDLFESIDKQILAEKVYRKRIRDAIGNFSSLHEDQKKKKMIVEKIYRAKIQNELKSLLEAKDTRIHNSTGMNALEDLFSNSNLLSVLRGDYKLLTTSYEQRKDYRDHMMAKIIGMFQLKDLDPEKSEINESLRSLFEEADISIQVSDEELPEDKIVGPVRDEIEDEKQNKEDDENAESIDKDDDFTGRNRADLAFSKIEKSIKTAYDTLGNPADRQEFKTYLIANLKMYFEQFEQALAGDVDPQYSSDVNKAVTDAQTELDDADANETEEIDNPLDF